MSEQHCLFDTQIESSAAQASYNNFVIILCDGTDV